VHSVGLPPTAAPCQDPFFIPLTVRPRQQPWRVHVMSSHSTYWVATWSSRLLWWRCAHPRFGSAPFSDDVMMERHQTLARTRLSKRQLANDGWRERQGTVHRPARQPGVQGALHWPPSVMQASRWHCPVLTAPHLAANGPGGGRIVTTGQHPAPID
jgi:hypothetical protein